MTAVLEVTEAKLESMTAREREVLADMFPEFRPLVVSFEANKDKALIDFSNQTLFTLKNGAIVPLAVLEMVAYSSLGGNKEKNEQSEHGEAKREAWDILHKVQKGKKAQGQTYALTPDGFRNRVAL